MTITNFRNEYAFLSNFYLSPFKARHIGTKPQIIRSVEHYFQAMKTGNILEQQQVLDARTPREAKVIGRRIDLRDDWEDVKKNVMAGGVKAKFDQNEDLRSLLINTGDSLLIEGNTWNDRTFGAVWNPSTKTWDGNNLLGNILMDLRTYYNNQPADMLINSDNS